MIKFVTISQLSELLGGRSRSSIYRDVDAKRLPEPLRFGGRVYFDLTEVEDTLRKLSGVADR